MNPVIIQLHLKAFGLNPLEIAITLLFGPICGAVFPPYFGSWSDRCDSSWGRRRPFIIWGTAAMSLAMLSLAWADSITVALLPSTTAPEVTRTILVILSMFLTLAVFVAVQAVQVGLRALLTDDSTANTWASRHITFSGFLAYFAAYLDPLKKGDSNTGSTVFARTSVFTTIYLTITILITCLYLNSLNKTQEQSDGNLGALTPLLYSTVSIFITFWWTSQSSDDGASLRISDDLALTDRDVWIGSNCIFGLSMLGTFFVTSSLGNVLLFSTVGISWAVSARTPYSLLGEELSRKMSPWNDDEASDHQGFIYGLNNLAICLPQILIMVLMGLAWLLVPTSDKNTISGVVWFLRLGGLSAFAAAYFATKLNKQSVTGEKDFALSTLENIE
ncbi:hypothetical protein E8E14_003922 [Neopestalotiopsis sp. 37M]|nr:hypothetical protein E8E14_003922 [Neopestalotiopsis sp. 37M]